MPARAAFYNYARGAPRNEGDGQDAGILPQQPATAFAAQSDRHGPAPAPAEKSVGLAGSSLQMTGVAGSFLGLRQRSAFHRTAAVFAAAGDVGRCGRAAPGAGDCLTGRPPQAAASTSPRVSYLAPFRFSDSCFTDFCKKRIPHSGNRRKKMTEKSGQGSAVRRSPESRS